MGTQKKLFRYSLSLIGLILIFAVPMSAQVSIGVEILSRYVWRGTDYGNSPSFQPSVTLTAGNFKIGTWGAYSFAGSGTPFAEHDLWASFEVTSPVGTIGVLATDYYFPSAGIEYFNYQGDGKGAHTIEIGGTYSGTASFPVALKALVNVHNDPDHSVYLEVGYPVSVEGVRALFFAGSALKKSVWYGTDRAAFVSVGVTLSRQVRVTESFSFPLSASFILNPEAEQSYLIVGVGL